jgi:hypothetical protein
MTGHNDTERILDAFLAPEHDQLPDRVVDAALTEIARTPQRRALRVPWRFPLMPQLLRYAVVAVVLVAVAGVGGALLLTRSDDLGPAAVAPSPTLAPTPTATAAPTASPAPSEVAPGITGFTPYTSPVYGLTIGIPDGWTQGGRATVKWQEGIDPEAHPEAPYSELFGSNNADGDVAFLVWQQPAGPGADLTSRDGLAAWVRANDPDRDLQGAIPLCVGRTVCGPAILLPASGDTIPAYIADPDAGLVTIVLLGRSDDHPSTTRYGGGIQLLESILTTMDVWTPEPGQVPPGG